jgi:hypothetical protein
MKVFDPSAPAMVHDHLNDRIFEWSPSWHAAYEKYAAEVEPGIISFNGLMLDGWRAVPVDAGSVHPEASRRSTTPAPAKRYSLASFLAQLWRPL